MNRNSVFNYEIQEIAKLIAEVNAEEIETFLTEILTSTELDTISKRWQIIKMLNNGYSQRQISKDLNVSLCKVTRGAKILKNTKSITKNLITKER